MKVIYHLNSGDLAAVPSEAAWAEAMGYDGVATSETAHDPFLPLSLAATATSRVTLDTRVAIAFPRSPMVLAYTARDLQDLSGDVDELQTKLDLAQTYIDMEDFENARTLLREVQSEGQLEQRAIARYLAGKLP